MICKELRIVPCDSHLPIWRSPCTTIKGRHSYSMFRCKGQLWMVCMHNRYWESRALWQFIVFAEDFFKTLAMFVSQAVSQFWYTKADSYAACFQRPARAVVGLHAQISDWTVLATVLADSQNPQDSWCALQARLRIRIFILSCRDTFKGRNSSSMLSTLMAAMHDLQRIENCTLWQSFTNLKESMYNDQRKTFIQHVSDAKGSSGWSACTIGTERVVLCDSLLYLQRIFQDTSYVCKPGCFSGL